MENNCKVTPGPKSIKEFFTSWYFWKPFIGVAVGVLAGLAYYYLAECKSGVCVLTSTPFRTMFIGGFLGFFITSSPCARFGK